MATAKQIDFLLTGLRHPDTDEFLEGGKVYAYEGGTTTPKALYIARDTAEGEAANPVILSATGNAEVFGNGVYKFTITDADDVTVFEFDNVEYTANISESGVGPLTADLDCDDNKVINLGQASEVGDAVEYQQWQDSITDLETATAAVQTNLDNHTFLDLTDTPASYSSQALKLVRVNAGATATEFVEFDTLFGASVVEDLSNVDSLSGEAGKIAVVKAADAGIEFKTITELAGETLSFTDLAQTPDSLTGEGSKYVKVNSDGTALEFVAQTSSDVPVGTVVAYAGSATLPDGWGACDGSEYTIADHPDLAAALGSTWGTGIGSVKVPDLRGMFIKGVGANSNPSVKTATGGAYTGAALGQFVADKFQGHDHSCKVEDSATALGYSPYGGNHHANITSNTSGVINDKAGSYGTARVAAYTEPGHACLIYIIKVK